ncbi:MAG: hypothetical protein HDQ98_00130 [Lachnospiraceae bacterium]|nr:hypothetical protein [Lachnospiraceae bacterium]
MEDDVLEVLPELPAVTPEPTPAAAPDPAPADSANDTPPANPVNTGVPETSQDYSDDQKEEDLDEIQDDLDEINEILEEMEQQDGEVNNESETGEEEQEKGSITNITVIHPPVQQITYQADVEAIYHSLIENDESDPVPVLVTESLIEKDPGIMDKRLEDYSVTEALLLLILITLWLRMIFDYFGRRRS